MKSGTFDTTKEAIAFLKTALNIESDTYLAGFLGVSEKSLNEWKRKGPGDLRTKGLRLTRFFDVIQYLKNRHTEIPASAYKNLIENGRVTIDPNDPEDGSVSLRNLILEDPTLKAWAPCVEEVVKEFIRDHIVEAEQNGKPHQSVRHA